MHLELIEDLLTPIFDTIPLPITATVFTLLSILSIILLVQVEKYRFTKTMHNRKIGTTKKKHTTLHVCRFVMCLFLMLCITYVTATTQLIIQAHKHGCDDYTKPTITELINSIKNSPKENRLPKSLTNITVIYYRFGCADCEKLYLQLSKKFNGLNNIYWIATRSTQGQKLRTKFPVKKVPSAIYIIDKNTAVGFDLYTKSKENKIEINTEQIKQLLEFRQKHMTK